MADPAPPEEQSGPPPAPRRLMWCATVAALCILGLLGLYLYLGRSYEPGWKQELRGRSLLEGLSGAQALFRESDKESDGNLDYGTLQELVEAGVLSSDYTGTRSGWLFEATYWASTSEFIWYATARSVGGGLDSYAINHAGVIFYTSSGPFPLNSADCQPPPGALVWGTPGSVGR